MSRNKRQEDSSLSHNLWVDRKEFTTETRKHGEEEIAGNRILPNAKSDFQQ